MIEKNKEWFDDRMQLLWLADQLEQLGDPLYVAIRHELSNRPNDPSFIVDYATGTVRASVAVGDRVRILEGYFKNFEGDVDEINKDSFEAAVHLAIFASRTPFKWFDVSLLEKLSS